MTWIMTTPALSTAACAAIAPAMEWSADIPPDPSEAAAFLEGADAAEAIAGAYAEEGDRFIAEGMARFYGKLPTPPAPVAQSWQNALAQSEQATDATFEEPLHRLAHALRNSPADATVEQMIDGLMAYLDNGAPSIRGQLLPQQKQVVRMITGGWGTLRPESVPHSIWDQVTKACAGKWVRNYGFDQALAEALGEKGIRQLGVHIAKKAKTIRSLGYSKSALGFGLHRHAEETFRMLLPFPGTVRHASIHQSDALNAAHAIESARCAAFETVIKQTDKRMRNKASTIATAVARQEVRGAKAGAQAAEEIIAACQEAIAIVKQTRNKTLVKKIPAFTKAIANSGMRGKEEGHEFVRNAVLAYRAALSTAERHDDENVRDNAPTIANAAAKADIRGENAGKMFAEDVIAAYQKVRSIAKGHDDENVRDNAPTIANAAAHIGIRGEEAGERFAEDVIAAYQAARKLAENHADANIKGNAPMIATITAGAGTRGMEAGAYFAGELIDAYRAARLTVENFPHAEVHPYALRIANEAMSDKILGTEAGKKYAEKAIVIYRDTGKWPWEEKA